MLEPFLYSNPGPWLGHRSREGRQGGTSANLSTAPGSVHSCSRRPWDSVGSSLPHRQLSSSESEPQPVIRSHLSQTHHLGSDRGGSYERSFQRPESWPSQYFLMWLTKLLLTTTYTLKLERMRKATHSDSEYDLRELLKDMAKLLPVMWSVHLLYLFLEPSQKFRVTMCVMSTNSHNQWAPWQPLGDIRLS